MVLFIILGLLFIVGLFLVAQYNKLVHLKNLVKEAWSGIDVQLKRRYDLIPNLVTTVKGYSTHEKNTLEEVVRLRNSSMQAQTIEEKAQVESALSQQLRTVFALAEAYPDLKANQNFLSLQKDLSEIEDTIQLSRRYYNGTAREYNTKIRLFPTNLIANLFGFSKKPYFELGADKERENPTVHF